MSARGEMAARDLAETAARTSYGKLVAFLAAQTRDVAAAEDALADAFAAALEDWPRNGCPDNPEAWLLTVARRRAIDVTRRQIRGQAIHRELAILAEWSEEVPHEIPDRRLGLMFACAHPAIEPGMRTALILQAILGLTAAAIASAFLVSPAAMGQRLVRAKTKIRQAGIPFGVPEKHELAERLEAVLDAVYAAYTRGWTDPAGGDLKRRELAGEALFLGALIIELMPDAPEALGHTSLMLHTDARRAARRGNDGTFIPLAEQDAALWDEEKIHRAEELLRRAGSHGAPGRYQLEAAIQSAHCHRIRDGADNWPEVKQLYDALWSLTGSPVVAVNRAMAMAESDELPAALDALETLSQVEQMRQYQPFWAVRAELFARAGNAREARRSFEVAIGLEEDPAVRRFLQKRQARLGSSGS